MLFLFNGNFSSSLINNILFRSENFRIWRQFYLIQIVKRLSFPRKIRFSWISEITCKRYYNSLEKYYFNLNFFNFPPNESFKSNCGSKFLLEDPKFPQISLFPMENFGFIFFSFRSRFSKKFKWSSLS